MEKAAVGTSAKPSAGTEQVAGTTTETHELKKPTVVATETQRSSQETIGDIASQANGAVRHDDTTNSREKNTSQKVNDTYQNVASIASISNGNGSTTDGKEIPSSTTSQPKDAQPTTGLDKLASMQRKPEDEDSYPLISVDSVICVTKSKPCDPQAVVPQSLDSKTVKSAEPDLSPEVLASVVTSAVVTEATLTLSGTDSLVLNDTRAVCDSRRVEAQVEQQIQKLAAESAKKDSKDDKINGAVVVNGAVKTTVNGELDISPESEENVVPSKEPKKTDDLSKAPQSSVGDATAKKTKAPSSTETKTPSTDSQNVKKIPETEAAEEPSPLSEDESTPSSQMLTEVSKADISEKAAKESGTKVPDNHTQPKDHSRAGEDISEITAAAGPINGSIPHDASEDAEQDIINSAVVMHKNLVNAEHSLDLSLNRIDVKPVCVESIPLPETSAVNDTASDSIATDDEKSSKAEKLAETKKVEKEADKSIVETVTKSEESVSKVQEISEATKPSKKISSPAGTTVDDKELRTDSATKNITGKSESQVKTDSEKIHSSSVSKKPAEDVTKTEKDASKLSESGDNFAEKNNELLSDELIMTNGIPSSMTESMIDFDTVHDETETSCLDEKIPSDEKKVISKDVSEICSVKTDDDKSKSQSEIKTEVVEPKDKEKKTDEPVTAIGSTPPAKPCTKSDQKETDVDISVKTTTESRTEKLDVPIKKQVDKITKESVATDIGKEQKVQAMETKKPDVIKKEEIAGLSSKTTTNGHTESINGKQPRDFTDESCRSSVVLPKTCDAAVGHEPRMIRVAAGNGESEEVDGEQASAEVEVTEDSGGPAGEEGEENGEINGTTTGGTPNGSDERTESRSSSKISTTKPDSADRRTPISGSGRQSTAKDSTKSGSATSRSSIPDAIQYEPPERKKSATSEVGRTATPSESKQDGTGEKPKDISTEPISEEQESKEMQSGTDDEKTQEIIDDKKLTEETDRGASAGKDAKLSPEKLTEATSEKDSVVSKVPEVHTEEQKDETTKTDEEKLQEESKEAQPKVEDTTKDEKPASAGTIKDEKTDDIKEGKVQISSEQHKSEADIESKDLHAEGKEDKGTDGEEKLEEPIKDDSTVKDEPEVPTDDGEKQLKPESAKGPPKKAEEAAKQDVVKSGSSDKTDETAGEAETKADEKEDKVAQAKTPEISAEEDDVAQKALDESTEKTELSSKGDSKGISENAASISEQATTAEKEKQILDEVQKELEDKKADAPAQVKADEPEESGAESKETQEKPKESEEESKQTEDKSEEPDVETKEPEKEHKEPESESKKTEEESERSDELSKQSDKESEEPKTESKEPEAESKEPVTESKELETESKEPEAESKEPQEESKEPQAESKEPETEPEAAVKEPEAETEESEEVDKQGMKEAAKEEKSEAVAAEDEEGEVKEEETAGAPEEISKTDDQSNEKEAAKSEEKEEDELEKDATPEASLDSGVSSDKYVDEEEKDKKEQEAETKEESEQPEDAEQEKEPSDVEKDIGDEETEKAASTELPAEEENEPETVPVEEEGKEQQTEEKPSEEEEPEAEKQDAEKEDKDQKAEEPPKSPVKRMKSPDKGGRRGSLPQLRIAPRGSGGWPHKGIVYIGSLSPLEGVSPLSSQHKPIKTPPSPKKPQKSSSPRKKNGMLSPIKTPKTPGADARKLPPIKAPVGLAPNPNLKNIKSKIGSFDNIKYKPGGGDKKVISMKLDWKATPKIGSLDNATYKPGGESGGKKHRSKERAHSKDAGDAQAGDGQSPMPPGDSEVEVEGAMAMESLIKAEGQEMMPSAITAES